MFKSTDGAQTVAADDSVAVASPTSVIVWMGSGGT